MLSRCAPWLPLRFPSPCVMSHLFLRTISSLMTYVMQRRVATIFTIVFSTTFTGYHIILLSVTFRVRNGLAMSKKTLLTLLLCCLATLLISACDTTPSAATIPAADTPYSATMPFLTLGTHQNIVFTSSDYNPSNFTSPTAILQRFDVTTQKTIAILKLPNINIQDAQISSNGEWIAFVARLTDHDELRLVRMDGKYAQTLLYSQPYAALSHLQWSPDQHYMLFDEEPPQSGPFITYLLDMVDNHVQVEIAPSNNANALSYIPRKWLDNNRALLVGTAPEDYAAPENIYILDIHEGAQQPVSALQQIYTGTLKCTDIDSNNDGSLLFISTCKAGQYPTGS